MADLHGTDVRAWAVKQPPDFKLDQLALPPAVTQPLLVESAGSVQRSIAIRLARRVERCRAARLHPAPPAH